QVTYLGRLHGLDRATAQQRTADLLERLQLEQRAGDPVERLSMGNQQRVQVAAALVHDPELLSLDEPFSGLDPIAIDTVLAVLRERARSGVPVLFSSHQLEVVERLCDDLVIIADGTIRAAGRRQDLQARFGPQRFELVVDDDAGWVRDLPGVQLVELGGPRAVLREAVRRGPVRGFSPVVPSLAEIFKEVV